MQPEKNAKGSIDFETMKKNTLNRDILGYLPVKALQALSGFGTIFILTRNLSPDLYGVYSSITTLGLLIYQLGGGWLTSALLFYYPDFKEDEESFDQAIIKIFILIALCASPICALLLLGMELPWDTVSFATIATLTLILQYILFSLFQAKRRINQQVVSTLMQTTSQILLLSLFMAFFRKRVSHAFIAQALACTFGSYVLIRRLKVPSSLRLLTTWTKFDKLVFYKLVRYGFPMSLWFFFTLYYTFGDRFFLKFFGYSNELGKYSSFRDLCTGLTSLLLMPILLATQPLIMDLSKDIQRRAEIEAILSRNIRWIFLIFAPLFVGTAVLGSSIYVSVMGQSYLTQTPIMLVVLLSILLGAISIYTQKGLEITTRSVHLARLAGVTALIYSILNLLSVPRYGVMGASVSGVISQVFYLTMSYWLGRSEVKLTIGGPFLFKLLGWTVSVTVTCHTLAVNFGLLEKLLLIFSCTFILYLNMKETRLIIKRIQELLSYRRQDDCRNYNS